MFKKLIVSFLCAIVVACTVLVGFCLLYFFIFIQNSMASIFLSCSVLESLTLRSEASADSDAITDLEPMTHLEVLEFTAGTNYAYVEVLSGEKKSYKGYVNSDYITKLGEPTVRIGTEE